MTSPPTFRSGPERKFATALVSDPERLKAVAEASLSGRLHDAELDAIVETLQAACDVSIAVVNLVVPGVQTYLAQVGIGVSRSVVDDDLSPCTEIVETGRLLTIADLRRHPVYWRNPLVQQGRIASFAGAPLIDDGVILGAVAVFDSAPRVFDPAQLSVLRHQARLAGSVIELRRSSARSVSLGGLDRLRSEVAQHIAAGAPPQEEAPMVFVGPTADADLLLLKEHLAALSDGTEVSSPDGSGG